MHKVLVTVVLTFAGMLFWRFSGESFVFDLPTNVKQDGSTPSWRKVVFLNHFPLGWYSKREVSPTFVVGQVLEVDLVSPNIPDWGWGYDKKSFRVQVHLNKDVAQTYFFRTNTDLKDAKRVVLRVSDVEQPAQALHQSDWFWLREFYSAEVIQVL
jgi:hypothetical protein